jgi:arylsulfatase A-like enzyme
MPPTPARTSHRPWEPDTAHAHLYDDAPIPVPDTYDDDYSFRASAAAAAKMRVARDLTLADLKAEVPVELNAFEASRWCYRRYIQDYLRCVASLDDNVGRILDFLDEEGLVEDTVVMYTSDQGFFLGDHGWYDKRFMYEESLRMPLLVRYPREVPAGAHCDELVLNVDFAQTILDYAGVPAHPRMQGESLQPVLRGEHPTDWRRSMYYRYWEHLSDPHQVVAHYGVRTASHKLVYYYGQACGAPGAVDEARPPEWELFDLLADPKELYSRYGDPEYAEVVAMLTAELDRLQAALGDTGLHHGVATP